MSKTIDEKVVEMRFDNKQFESNVATSMSTLEKLKRSLKLDGASKGLEDIDKASKKVDMSGLGGAVESVKMKFSALDVIAVTALANITNSAVNAGKQLIKSLSVDQLSAGFQKFSDKTTSVATLVAQGNAIEDVNEQLDRLNWFTDETSYNFTEMVSNIAKFTATGKGLNESVTAMEGIATWAALSGQNAATASRAMYQLSQAMGAGTMRLEDYRSIQNASMDTEEFRQKCIDAAISLKTLQDNGDGTYSSLVEGASGASWTISQFASNLTSEMWLTSDVMMKVFNEYSSAVEGIYDAADERGMLASEIIDEIHDKANELKTGTEATSEDIDAAIRALGYTLEDGSLQFDSFGLKAFEAAQKARTFQDAIDSVKDAVSTGWMKTFEIIFGDAEKATELWTDLANTLWDIFAAGGETRNQILEFALNFAKPWETIKEKLNGAGFGKIKEIAKSFENITTAVESAADKLEYFQDIVNKVWHGDFNNWGDNPDRRDLLTEAGYDHRVVQELVNKGYQYKLTIEDVEAAHKKFGLTMDNTTEATKKTTEATKEASVAFGDLTDEQLEQAGLTEDEIDLYRALEKEAKRLGTSVSDLAEEMSTNDGRTLLIESFKNALDGLIGIGTVIKSAWNDIFNPPGIGEMAVKLYGIIKSLNEFSEKLRLTDKDTGELNETGKKLQRTFKGIFAILDIVRTVLGGGLRFAFTALTKILSAFNLDILDVTANIGDALVAFRDWALEGNALAKAFDWFISKIPIAVNNFKEWFSVFKQTPAVRKLTDAISAIVESFRKLTSGEIDIGEFARSLGENLAKVLKSLPGIALQIGRDFIAGFKNGISDSVSGVIKKIVTFCLNFVEGFKEALGVHSPSWKAYNTATDFFQGFINGAKASIGPVIEVLKKIGEVIVKVFKSLWSFITDNSGNIEWGKLFAGGVIVGLLLILKKFANAFSSFAKILDGVGSLIYATSKAIKSFSKVLNGIAWDLKAKALLKMAIAIGVLVAAIWVLTQIDDTDKLWNAVGVIFVLSAILVGLSIAMDKLSRTSLKVGKNGASIEGIKSGLLQIGIAIALLAVTVKMIGNMDPEKAAQGFKGLAAIAVGMLAFLSMMGLISRYTKDVSGIGGMMMKLSIAMMLMVGVCKLASSLSGDEMLKGAAFATAFAIFVIAITKVARSAGNNVSKVGGMILKVAIAMALMVGLCKLISMLSVEEMLKGAAFAAAFVIFIKALVLSTKIGKKQQLAKIGGMVLSISVSLALMVGVCKLVGMLSVGEMIKGAVFVAAFVLLLKALMSILTIGNEQKIAKVTGTIFAMSAAIGILAAVSILLGFVDLPSLAKGVAAVTILSAMMVLMVRGLKGAQNVKGSIIAMTVAIGLMAASVVALSFIDTKSLITAASSMTIMMAAFALMIKSLQALGKKKIPITPILALTGVVLVLTGVMYVLKDIDPKSAIASTLSLAGLMLAMTGVLAILSLIGNKTKKAFIGILALNVLALSLWALVWVLQGMSGVKNAMDSARVLIDLAGTLTLLLIPLTAIGAICMLGGGMGAIAVAAGIAALNVMVLSLWAVIWVLQGMSGVKNASANADLLINFMTIMTDLLLKISLVAPLAVMGVSAMTGLVLLIGAIGTMAVAIGKLMDDFSSIEKFLDTGLPVLEQLAGSIGTMIGKFIGGIGEGLSGSLIKIGDNIAEFMDRLATASDNAAKIKSESFNGVEKLMGIMALIGAETVGTTIADIFTLGGTSMDKFEKDGVAFFNAMKAIGEASSDVKVNEEAIDSVIGVAERLVDLQSSIEPIGGVISWLAGRDDLGRFGINAAAFVYSMKLAFGSLDDAKFNTEAMDSIIDAATSLSDLQSSLKPIGGVVSWFTGRDDLGRFGVNIVAFINSMLLIFAELAFVGELNTAAMDAIIDAATKLSTLQSSLKSIGGVVSWFTGRDDLGKFGENVASFIESMKTALSTLNGVENLNEDALTSVIIAAERLSEFQKSLDNMGGVIKWFTGRDDIGKFGENLYEFARAMGKLKSGMGEDGISEAVVTSITNAGNAIIALQKALPTEGLFDGKMNLSEFSKYIEDFATAMSGFVTKTSSINSSNITTAIDAAYRIKNLINTLSDIDTSGLKAFTGIGTGGAGADGAAYQIAQTISEFSSEVAGISIEAVTVSVDAATKLKSLIYSLSGLDTSGIENFKVGSIGEQMKSYSDKVAGIDTVTVSSSISNAERLKSFIYGLAYLDTSGIENFKAGSIGTELSNYANSISGTNMSYVSSSIAVADDLRVFIGSLARLNTSGVNSFKTAVNELSTVSIDGFVKSFSESSAKLSSAGADMINGLINGMRSKLPDLNSMVASIFRSLNDAISSKASTIENAGGVIATRLALGFSNKKKEISTAVSSGLSEAVTSINGKYESFYNAGSYLVTGFCNGISENSYKAAAKAKAMAEAAVEAAREALKINSPSKVFKAIGSGIPEGFAMGIGMLGGEVEKSVTGMASSAINTTRSAMANVLDALNNDMDTQPSIRPVIDLSNVKTGVNTINGMFDGVQTVGISSSFNAINASMNRKLQNGTNDDVISAINKLRTGLDNNRGDTYNFGDFTYDSGSEVADAVGTLIRYAKIGRRV